MKRYSLCMAVAVAAISCQISALAQRVSFSTDFDGIGSGSSITVNYGRSAAGRPQAPSSSSSSSSGASVQQYLAARYEEQEREAARRAEAERLKAEADLAKRRNDVIAIQRILQQLQALQNDEPSVIQRAAYTEQILMLEKQFEAARSSYLASIPSYERRLSASIGLINVPPPAHPLHYKRILILGAGDTPDYAKKLADGGEQDPFSADGQRFDDVFAFGVAAIPAEVGRVVGDHFLGQFDRLSPATVAQIGRLRGATADEVVCHSNGCRVAKVLIETGQLKVDKLRVLGGDNAALEIDAFRALKESKGLSEVSLYMMQGDPIPMIEPGWKIMDLMHKVNQTIESLATAHSADTVYQLLGMARKPGFTPGADVQVHVLSYPTSSDPVSQHLYDHYSRVVKGWRMSGCLDPGGAMSSKCIIY